jgi:hypothetical protein
LRYVVQELIQSPFLHNERKIDLRGHLLIDANSRERSGWVPPILVRQAGSRYRRGALNSENLNLSYQRKRFLAPRIAPLADYDDLPRAVRQRIREEAQRLAHQMVDAYFTCSEQQADGRPEVGNRVFLWGFDVGLSRTRNDIRAYLLENNLRAQLYRDEPRCDAAMANLIAAFHVPALVRRSRAAVGINPIGLHR